MSGKPVDCTTIKDKDTCEETPYCITTADDSAVPCAYGFNTAVELEFHKGFNGIYPPIGSLGQISKKIWEYIKKNKKLKSHEVLKAEIEKLQLEEQKVGPEGNIPKGKVNEIIEEFKKFKCRVPVYQVTREELDVVRNLSIVQKSIKQIEQVPSKNIIDALNASDIKTKKGIANKILESVGETNKPSYGIEQMEDPGELNDLIDWLCYLFGISIDEKPVKDRIEQNGELVKAIILELKKLQDTKCSGAEAGVKAGEKESKFKGGGKRKRRNSQKKKKKKSNKKKKKKSKASRKKLIN